MGPFLALFLCLGALFIGLSIPFILRRVPPNRWYGFRTRKTLASPEVWYPANAYSSWLLLALGVVIMLVAVGAWNVPEMQFGLYASIVGAVAGVGVIVVLTLSLAHLDRYPEHNPPDADES